MPHIGHVSRRDIPWLWRTLLTASRWRPQPNSEYHPVHTMFWQDWWDNYSDVLSTWLHEHKKHSKALCISPSSLIQFLSRHAISWITPIIDLCNFTPYVWRVYRSEQIIHYHKYGYKIVKSSECFIIFLPLVGHSNYTLPITMTSQWARWRLKSPASPLFTQPFIQAQVTENIKAPRHWFLWREFTGDRWIPHTKGQ